VLIRSSELKKDRQYNDQKKIDKMTNIDTKTLHRKLKIDHHESPKIPGMSSDAF
jgi:hypothetical protein